MTGGSRIVRLLLVALALAFGLAAPARAANVEFTGSFLITATSSGCSGVWPVGEELFARFAPRALGDNGPDTRLSAFSRTYAFNYTLRGTTWTSLSKVTEGTYIGRGLLEWSSAMKVTTQTPSSITASTIFVTLVGQISNHSGLANCTVAFRSALARRP